jgi:hypothetical protein
MKEIHHKDNQHLNPVSRIRDEAAELGFDKAFLGYSDTSVCENRTSYRSRPAYFRPETALRECHVG